MAEYVTVPARNLVALGDADPVAAAPLADAGLTP
jgi:propanol-preferring alcohol dehydrogenase